MAISCATFEKTAVSCWREGARHSWWHNPSQNKRSSVPRHNEVDDDLARAVFVIGPDNKLKHVEYVSDITQHPNYDAALAAAK